MKNLLRMSLFIIARAGLSLAVVAWTVSQWWNPGAASDISNRYIQGVSLNCHGVLALRSKAEGSEWIFSIFRRRASQDDPGFVFGEGDWDGPDRDFGVRAIRIQKIGIVYGDLGTQQYVSVRHWLPISLFTAFNIALHFIYRKRPQGKPCEV